ncbi:MAG: hypothetical protein D6719_12115 [Candidatus Dadabacteria bacterium]|nr:MAG: hypothetical protein D6719_12115 [Candidatus Dadabacteria bacterium]
MCLISSFSFAAPQFPELKKGIGFNEVIKEWGLPEEKIEYETSRKEKWLYPDSRYAVFTAGKLSEWAPREEPQSEGLPVSSTSSARTIAKDHGSEENAEVVQDILSEIMDKTSEASSSNKESKRKRERNRSPLERRR